MSDPILIQLEERRRKARLQIQRGNAELAECDRFERFYRQAKGASAPPLPPAQGALLVSVDESTGAMEIGPIVPPPGRTLKERIMYLLEKRPGGLVSQEILKELRAMGDPSLQRTTVSPQLSRLRQEGLVVNQNGVWRLPHKDEAIPSTEGMAS